MPIEKEQEVKRGNPSVYDDSLLVVVKICVFLKPNAMIKSSRKPMIYLPVPIIFTAADWAFADIRSGCGIQQTGSHDVPAKKNLTI